MTDTPRKAGSVWKCSKCKYPVTTQPGTDMADKRCCKPGCPGKLQYQGGRFVYEHEVEFKVISAHYLVGVTQKKKRDRAIEVSLTNRMTKYNRKDDDE